YLITKQDYHVSVSAIMIPQNPAKLKKAIPKYLNTIPQSTRFSEPINLYLLPQSSHNIRLSDGVQNLFWMF
ncbi:hypothetical protein, partial [Candidatus Parabeggiatoa sp. HSG14]|uniref:hypothetical protein n=1 Tax=Candidatus Parabeggiatoa sp. HSG14 TaxID=3055593 RepID=UPI0025A77AFE|nr:hypothetical protein [Thiotrichales bacterium HSG14]